MTDFFGAGINGIPNYGFQGTGGGVIGGIPNQQPAMSAYQIQQSMGLPGPAAQNQAALNQNFSNFGQQTDYYSALGAAYGRATGGFGGGGGASVFDTGAAPYNDYGQPAGGFPSMDTQRGYGFDNAQYLDPAAQAYLQANPDVAAAGMNPLQHYQQYGQAEGRAWNVPDPQALLGYNPNAPIQQSWPPQNFNDRWHATGGQTLQGMPGEAVEAVTPNPFGPVGWGKQAAPPTFGDSGASSNYLAANPDVAAAGMNPLQHYLQFGMGEGRSWGDLGSLDTKGYLSSNPDVAASGMNPLQHYLMYGRDEGRSFGGNPAGLDAAYNAIKAGKGWTIAQSVGNDPTLSQNLNQSIYDIGNASQPGMFDQWNGYQPPKADHFSDQTQYLGGLGPGSGSLGFQDQFGNYSSRNEQGGSNQFADRWYGLGDAGINAGSPSMYYTGNQYQAGQMPQGFAPPYSFDNQNGALPLGGYRPDRPELQFGFGF
jgi:hypothetical protein